ncbi:tellurite resistance TerB family protein [Pseudoduganella lutea]|uniref:TerB family tellurite resistance protein n=1 Tax=Pseudoduganella lutea TaxID=321985 RepID=A0A4P6L2V5_9BURK|nr:TerB family tellurite resistance protein [Pseudoduganella lutea]QBE65966.1 TerB family tellurite resistance protein [Pseudoduganella lutea]
MRPYETNSPQARARLLALSMVVDGHLDPAELQVLKDAPVLSDLGIDWTLFSEVLDELCSDMLGGTVRHGAVEIGPALLDSVLGEITDPGLQRQLLVAMLNIVEADARLAHAERLLVARAGECWIPDAQGEPVPA